MSLLRLLRLFANDTSREDENFEVPVDRRAGTFVDISKCPQMSLPMSDDLRSTHRHVRNHFMDHFGATDGCRRGRSHLDRRQCVRRGARCCVAESVTLAPCQDRDGSIAQGAPLCGDLEDCSASDPQRSSSPRWRPQRQSGASTSPCTQSSHWPKCTGFSCRTCRTTRARMNFLWRKGPDQLRRYPDELSTGLRSS